MILSAWDIKGNGAGKAFLIIVNGAVHGIAVPAVTSPETRAHRDSRSRQCGHGEAGDRVSGAGPQWRGKQGDVNQPQRSARCGGADPARFLPGFGRARAMVARLEAHKPHGEGSVAATAKRADQQQPALRSRHRCDAPAAHDARRAEPRARGAGAVRSPGRNAAAAHPPRHRCDRSGHRPHPERLGAGHRRLCRGPRRRRGRAGPTDAGLPRAIDALGEALAAASAEIARLLRDAARA